MFTNTRQVKVPIKNPTTEISFAFIKTPTIHNGSIVNIVPVEGNVFNRLNDGSVSMTREAKMTLCMAREALKTVFEANGMDFEKDAAADYAPLERRLTR